jgi:hypothetical protein
LELPDSLQPWSELLAMLPRDVALSLGPWITRLAPVVGPLRVRSRRGAGEPDGYDGLTRRGGYERLLASEWLLADEAPDEFLRRAAMGELAFLQRVQRDPARALTSVALFDIGPGQLGASRVVHLAVLFVLARRAAMAGARFGWGLLQKPPGSPLPADKGGGAGLRLDVTRANVSQLLQSRSGATASDDDLDAWMKLSRDGGDWEDVWIVGGADTYARWSRRVGARAGTTHGCVEVSDPVDVRERHATVRVLRGPITRGLTLDLPDDATCVRFLRDPLVVLGEKPAPAPPKRVGSSRSPVSNPVFSPSGTRLIARNMNGDLLVFQVPNSPRATPGKAKVYSVGSRERVIAVGFAGKKVVVLARREREVHLYDWSNHVFKSNDSLRRFTFVEDLLPTPEPNDELLALHVFHPDPSRWMACIVDARRRLLALRPDEVSVALERVSAARVNDAKLRVAQDELPTPREKIPLGNVEVIADVPQFAFVNAAGAASSADEIVWVFHELPTNDTVAVRESDVPVGFTQTGTAKGWRPQMLVVRDGCEVVRVGESEETVCFRCDADIAHAVTDTYGGRIATLTTGGTLSVHEVATGRCLMRVVPESR